MSNSNSAQHTPGPWIVTGKYSDEIRALVGRQTKTIAYLGNGTKNAHLIAAAPDLLAALQMAEFHVLNHGRPEEINQLSAAIAKAGGAQ